jgi:hypothetical protein
LGDELPDVRFKVEEYDAIALVAAMLRTARQLGVVEGIELANAAVSNLKQ